MRRILLTFAIATLFGGFVAAGNASAGLCSPKASCYPVYASSQCAPVVPTSQCLPTSQCAPAPCYTECAPKKCHSFHMPKMKMPKLGCFHKKAVVSTCDTCYSAPVYAAPQAVSSPQMLPVPQK